MLNRILLIVLSLLMITSLRSQDMDLTVFSELGNGIGYAVKVTDNGKLILGGVNTELFRVRLDEQNRVMEQSTFDEFELTVANAVFTEDNKVLILYNSKQNDSTDYYLAKLDESLNSEWIYQIPFEDYRAYSFNNNPRPEITITSNNDIIFKVLAHSEASLDYIIRLHSNGELVWISEIPHYASFTQNSDVIELPNGNLYTTSSSVFFFLNSEGEIILSQSYTDKKSNCVLLNDSTIVSVSRNHADILDTEGNIIDSLDITGGGRLMQLIADYNNGFLILNKTSENTSTYTWYDSDFNLKWSESFNLNCYDAVFSAGKCYATGITSSHIGALQFDPDNIPDQYLFLLSPNGGEILPESIDYYYLLVPNRFSIEWMSKGIGAVTIEYSSDSGEQWQIITDKYPDDEKEFTWELPYTPGTNYLIKISSAHFPGTNDISRSTFSVNPYTSVNYIATNEVKMWIGNNGMSAHDPYNDDSGFFWPDRNEALYSIFADGILWGGKVNGEIRVNGANYRYGLKPGAILDDGTPDDPMKSEYKMFKLQKGWENFPPGRDYDRNKYDYNNWPAQHGAPYIDVDNDGQFTRGIDEPEIIGDETLFYVANDLDEKTSKFTYGSSPIGLEFQQTLFAYNTPVLKDAVFKKICLINKGSNLIDSMYVTYWVDGDLGFAGDDFIGVDTLLDLGYFYNGDNNDNDIYGEAPPALGHLLLQGPIVDSPGDTAFFSGKIKTGSTNLGLISSNLFIGSNILFSDWDLGIYNGAIQAYNNMKGLMWDGTPYIDPVSGGITKFCLPGDPVNKTGWYEGEGWPGGPAPDDRRYTISSGPFTMMPGDTQEVVYAIFMARGSDNINSVAKLKEKARELHEFWGNDIPVGVRENVTNQLPEQYSLAQNYPNPFNPATTINYQIAKSKTQTSTNDQFQNVVLKVYDILGREVGTLVNERQKPGRYKVKFDASNLASGIYFYKLETDHYISTKKMILLR